MNNKDELYNNIVYEVLIEYEKCFGNDSRPIVTTNIDVNNKKEMAIAHIGTSYASLKGRQSFVGIPILDWYKLDKKERKKFKRCSSGSKGLDAKDIINIVCQKYGHSAMLFEEIYNEYYAPKD